MRKVGAVSPRPFLFLVRCSSIATKRYVRQKGMLSEKGPSPERRSITVYVMPE